MTNIESRVQAIFEEAVDLSTGDRTAFIDEACGEDGALKHRVLALLEFSADDDDDLVTAAGLSNTPDELIGTNIDKFMIKSLLGEGGFGAVYLAEQHDPVKRQVAIKIIKLGMDSKSIVARFQAERQALAHMNHPGIARIIQAGTTSTPLIFSQLDRDGDGVISPDEWQTAWDEIDVSKDGSISASEWQSANRWGRPYFVMEYVPGESITDYCVIHSFDINERIAIFQQACAAIQHAHSRGIIHRDIKPSNILVTSTPEGPRVKVIDFGIAKALSAKIEDATFITHEGQIVGTPEFMSPEQCFSGSKDIGTGTDIYSLGVLLYELLTGYRPFDSKTLRSGNLVEIQRIICEDTPSKPSTRFRELSSERGELQTALLGARRLNVKSHYKALCGDLDWIIMKCLEKDPERRYLTAIALSADLGRHLANEPVDAGPPSARYRFKKFARRNAGLLIAVAVIATSILAGAVFSTYYAIEAATRAREATAATLAATKSRDAALTAKEAADEREREATRLNTRLMTMKTFAKQGIIEAFYRKDLAGFDRRLIKIWLDNAAEVANADQFRTGTVGEADLLTFVGTLYRLFGFDEEARLLLQSALEIRKRALGSEHIETIWQRALLAQVLDLTGDKAAAQELAITVAERFSDLLSSDQDEAIETAVFGVMRRMLKASPALFDMYLPVALAAVSSQLGTSHVTYGELVWQRGIRSEALNHLDEAIRDYQSALEIYTAAAGAEHRVTLELRFFLARASELAGRTSVAKLHFETCYRGLFRIWGPTHWTTGKVGSRLAALLIGLGQFDEAEPYLLEPFVACQKELGLNHELTQRMADGLVGLYEAWDRPTEATRYRSMLVVPDQSAAPTGEGPTHD